MAKKAPAKKKTTKAKVTGTAVTVKQMTVEQELLILEGKLKPAHVRFVHLYLGAEGGVAWNNATKAYALAYDKDFEDKKEYGTCKTEGNRLLTNPDILKYRTFLLRRAGYTEEAIKERYSKLSFQEGNLGVSLQATDRMAKITGVLKDDGLKVNIPELERLGEGIKSILEGKSHSKK